MTATFIKLWTSVFFFIFVLCQAQKTQPNQDLFLKLLKESRYDRNQQQNFPDFKYQSGESRNLTALREKYRLDSIAGKGTDLNKIINLLEWMHKAVPHEDEDNLSLLTAENIIETYRKKGFAQGCYPLAISMNEIFLAMGFKSRIVICFPADFKHPNGGHVINTVYVPSMKKWVWMDPQFNAFLKDRNNNLLSINEVRENIIHRKPVFLNPDANYHGEKIDADYYLKDFMTEHLYRFISPLSSEFNSETRAPEKVLTYVELLPSNSKVPAEGMFENHEKKNSKVITYHTNNPELFWKTPE